MLMVLPTPELCISIAERWPPSQAPAATRNAFLFGRERQGADRIGLLAGLDQPRMPGIGHVIDLLDVVVLEDLENVVTPIAHSRPVA